MLCHIVETIDKGNPRLARAQCIQCMKALREFADLGSWRTAWPLTHMPEPLKRHHRGGLEVETEVVLGWLRTEDDLDKRIRNVGKVQEASDLVSDDGAEEPDAGQKGAGKKGDGKKKRV